MSKHYRISLVCPRCDKPWETIQEYPPRPRIECGDCLMSRTEIVEMLIVSAELMPDEPMVNLKIVEPDGEKLED